MDQTTLRRRPVEGGYARGDEKRLKIIEAALRVFGEHGFEKASTRQIAREAGVNPPALQYYFDGKEGLHLACAQHIAERSQAVLQPAYERALGVTKSDTGGAADALCDVLDALADFIFESVQIEGWSRFLARGQGEGNGPGYSHIRQQVKSSLHDNCERLVSIATGIPVSDMRARLCAISILGQLTAFHLGRESALASLGWPDFRDHRLDLLKALIRIQTHGILDAHRRNA